MSIIKKRKKGVNIVKQNPELKYKKYFKRILKRKSKSQGFPRNQILTAHSICGFYSKENKCLSYNEISSIILTIKRNIRKKTNKTLAIFLKTFSQIPITRKPIQTRMGKGKGSIDSYLFPVKKGEIFLEISTPNSTLLEIKKIFNLISNKVSFKIGFITSI